MWSRKSSYEHATNTPDIRGPPIGQLDIRLHQSFGDLRADIELHEVPRLACDCSIRRACPATTRGTLRAYRQRYTRNPGGFSSACKSKIAQDKACMGVLRASGKEDVATLDVFLKVNRKAQTAANPRRKDLPTSMQNLVLAILENGRTGKHSSDWMYWPLCFRLLREGEGEREDVTVDGRLPDTADKEEPTLLEWSWSGESWRQAALSHSMRKWGENTFGLLYYLLRNIVCQIPSFIPWGNDVHVQWLAWAVCISHERFDIL